MGGIAGPLPKSKGRFVFEQDGKKFHVPVEMEGQEVIDLIYAAEHRGGQLTVIQITPTGKVLKSL